MIQRESAINLLQELVQKLESPQFRLPSETQILTDDQRLNKDFLNLWKLKVDSLVKDLCIKWLAEEMNLETIMQLWVNSLVEDQEFLAAFMKLGEIIAHWKSQLREIFLKDESLFTMPSNVNVPDDREASVVHEDSDSVGSISDND